MALDEVAEVARGHDRSGQLVSYNGEPAVMLSITKQARTNTLQLVERLQTHAAQRNTLLAAQGMRLTLVDDQTHATRSAISIMESNAVFGLLAVLATCWLFLGSRLAVLIGLGVPFALAGTFIAVDLVGNTLNLTVLLGVVIALGMLVDDAVVIVESIYYRLQRGEIARTAVINGISEVGLPVLASVLTTIAAFLPLMLLPGILGDFMFIVPFVVTVGLLVSLLEAYWIMPTHILILGLDNRRSRLQPWRERFTRSVRVKYARLLVAVMRRPKAGMAVLVLVMAAAGGALASGMVRLEFFAFDPIRLFYVSVDMPAGVTLERSLDEAQRAVRVVEDALPASELRAIAAYSGLKFSDTEPVYGDQYAQVLVSLLPRADGMRDTGDIIAALRPHIEALNGEGRFSFLELKGGPPTARPVSVKVKSDDYPQLRAAADAMLAEVARLPGAKDITDDDVPGRNELRLLLNREKLARAGVSPGEVSRLLRLYGEGEIVATTRAEGEKIEVVVRAKPENFVDVTELLQRTVALADGRQVQLGELVNHELRLSKGYIRHYQLTRAITVEAELDRTLIDTVSANDRLQEAWAALQPQFPGVELDFSGELEDINESLNAMGRLFALGLGLIYLILAAQFRSYWQPVMILVTVPLAFTGVVFGLLLSGNPLSLYTLYGVIALTGIAVNSAIVLIDAANERRAVGMSVQHAIIYAARRRVVPILITSTTTIGGLFSLAVGLGGKSLMWGPVAASIVWGLGFSTVLTLFAIPLVYRLALQRRA